MRLIEFASAEEQIELWKLVSASVWASLQQQEQQQRQAQATAAAGRARRDTTIHKGKHKRTKGKGRLKLPRASIPSAKAAPKPAAPQAPPATAQVKPTNNATNNATVNGTGNATGTRPQQSAQQSQQLLKPTVDKTAAIPSAAARVANAAVAAMGPFGADNSVNKPTVAPAVVPVNTVRQRVSAVGEPVKRR